MPPAEEQPAEVLRAHAPLGRQQAPMVAGLM
jgi:hypothetical protein